MKELITLEQFIEVQQLRLKRFQKIWECGMERGNDLYFPEMEYEEWEAKERIIFEVDVREANKNNDL